MIKLIAEKVNSSFNWYYYYFYWF